MIIYNYDDKTFEYTGQNNADLDPEQSRIEGEYIYLIPANSTTIKPPKIKKNEVALWDKTNWKIVPDYRNTYVINEFKEIKFIKDIGALPDGYFVITEEQAEKVKQDPLYYIVENEKLIINPNYDEDKKAQEREKILRLSLTKREVFLALYAAKGITPEQVRGSITDTAALIEFDYATEYYRGNPLIDAIGSQLGYTTEDLDYLFINKVLPEKE